MRFVHKRKFYDTENSILIHSTGFAAKPGEAGRFTQELYESPNGGYFYVNWMPDGSNNHGVLGPDEMLYTTTSKYFSGEKDDEIDCVINWLESHDGAEVILERWPQRIEAG